MSSDRPKSLMRNLGQFFGHVAKGIKSEPSKPQTRTHEVRREVEEREETGPGGERITLRRTTIEEVEIKQPRPPSGPAEGGEP